MVFSHVYKSNFLNLMKLLKPLTRKEKQTHWMPLSIIAEDLFLFFDGVKSLRKAKKVIEKKYEIKKERDDCWPADDIKRVWEQTQRMDIKSSRRRYWAHVIILQMLKRFMVRDKCKQNSAQEDHDDTTTDFNQACKTKPKMKENSEDASSESSSAFSTDVAPSLAELRGKICYPHLHSNESRNAALENESEDTLDNNCEQRKSIDKHEELNFTDTPNRMKAESENGRQEDSLWSTDDINQACGKAEERSTQSSDELKTTEAAGGDKQSSGAHRKSSKSGLNQTDSVSQGRTGKQCPTRSQATRNYPGTPGGQSGSGVSAASKPKAVVKKKKKTIYIRIPFSLMFGREPDHVVQPVPSPYKLINGFPSDTDLRIRKSYAMSFNKVTGNAEWVYEILNRDTLVNNCEQRAFEQGYVRGHLAAARNHKWCREALNDTYLFSNIIPQNSILNNTTWKTLENKCRRMTRNNVIRNVHVYTGPLYRKNVNLRLNGKRVPSHLFKVIIVENVNGTVEEPECYMMPNEDPQNNDLNVYLKNIEECQRLSGLTFIERRPNLGDTDSIIRVRLEGENLNEIARVAEIEVITTHNENW